MIAIINTSTEFEPTIGIFEPWLKIAVAVPVNIPIIKINGNKINIIKTEK